MANEELDPTGTGYPELLADISQLLETARQGTVRAVNTIMTLAYGTIGQRIVELEQRGAARAHYGEELVTTLARDLTARFGRGFSRSNLLQMRQFYLAYRDRFPAPLLRPVTALSRRRLDNWRPAPVFHSPGPTTCGC